MRWSNDSHLAPAILLHLSPPPLSGPSPRHLQCLLLLLLCLLSHLPSAVVSASVSARDKGGERKTPTTVCGTQFTDTASSALLADVVLEGRVRQKILPAGGDGAPVPGVRYNVSIQVRKQVWKGRELVNQGKKARNCLSGLFWRLPLRKTVPSLSATATTMWTALVGQGWVVVEEEEVGGVGDCVADVTEGSTYIFFLRDVGHKKGRYFHISALPVKKNRRVSRTVNKILKANAAKKPSIQRLKGPRAVKAGASLTLRCKAKAKPNPTFTWYKDGEEIRAGRGLRIKNNKRGSRLKISKADKARAGVYTCQAANALGEASKNITIKVRGSKQSRKSYNLYRYMNEDAIGKDIVSVTTPELIHVACQKQTYCFNGGTCRYIPALHQSFCQCPKKWAGHRCEILDLYGPGNKDKTREAKLEFERVLIIVGIVIALLVFVIICIASYFLANRRRKRWEARRRMKQRLVPESYLLLDKTDGAQPTHFAPSCRPQVQKETQPDFSFHPPAFPPRPDLEAKDTLPYAYPNSSANNILLNDASFPPLTRTTAATVAAVPPPPPPTNPNQKPARPVSNVESPEVESNGVRSRLKAVSVNENCSARPRSWRGQVPDSKSMPVILDSEGDVPELIELSRLGGRPPGSSNPGLNSLDEVDSPPSLPASHTSPQQPFAPDQSQSPVQNGAEHAFNGLDDDRVASKDPARLLADYDFLDSMAPPEEPKKWGLEDGDYKKALPVNGVVESWESDDEVLDKPLLPPLHISEEDLNKNAPRLDSFDKGASSPPFPSPPEPFATDRASPSFSSLSPAGSVPTSWPTPLTAAPAVAAGLGPRPGSVSEDDSAGFLPHTLSSTEASSPLTEGTPQGETYSFDPCVDSDPDDLGEQFMHGSPKKGTGCYRGAEDKQDYERRLRNVCADQDAIPI